MTTRRATELATATLGEGALILVIGALGWATRQPLVFASLGPTAYEPVEKPSDRSARAYNIIVGHLVGLGSGIPGVTSAESVASAKCRGVRDCNA